MLDLPNKIFGRLRVKDKAGRVNNNMTWNCVCICGREKIVATLRLTSGNVRSCGCLKLETQRTNSLTHGLSASNEYYAWSAMKKRCQKPTCKKYPYYGGRGIRLCKRWQKFAGFLADMGRRPSDAHTIERIDNDGNYEPSNCRWATMLEQQQNKKNTIFVSYGGMNMSFSNAWRTSNSCVSQSTARARLARGWNIDDAFTREIGK